MLPINFKPSGTFDLIRLGSKHDGGYLVETKSISEAKTLLSFGIHDNWLFEKQLLKMNEIPLHAFDCELGLKLLLRNIVLSFGECFFNFKKPIQAFSRFGETIGNALDYKKFFKDNRMFSNLMIGYDGSNSKSLSTILSDNALEYPIFLKCDIEGWEYRILDEMVSHSDKFCALTIEFHDVDLHLERIKNFIEKFSLEVVHIHPNNYGGVDDKDTPIAIEMTFARSPQKISSTPSLPHQKDAPCDPDHTEIDLKFD
ncbi:MAG: hypothetical protein ACPGYT_07070 [Nitrospirales bacterium]